MSLTPRYPHLLHGGDYNPDQWLDRPDILREDIRLMKEAHINCVSLAIFAWAKLEPREGEYQFDWLEKIIDGLYENGIYTVLATPSGSKPLWMSEKYPEIRRVRGDGRREPSGGRHNHCYTSPTYREKVRQMDTALAKRFSKHPGVILWHLSNEYGGECRCPQCEAAFRQWLKKKYGTLEALNHAWWNDFWAHTVTDWEQIHAPGPEGEDGAFIQQLDWKRFVTDQVVDFAAAERDAVKAVDPTLPVTTNLMYYFDDYNYFKFKDVVDVVSWDAYPQWRGGDNSGLAVSYAMWHDLMRSMKQQPFLLMESTPSTTNWCPVSKLKKPGQHQMSSMQAVAHGSDSVQYFQFRKSRGGFEKFHGAVVDHCGTGDTREFQDVQAMGLWLEALEGLQGATTPARAAIVYDWENKWAMEDAMGPRNVGLHYVEQVQAHYKALWRMGVPVDIIDEECGLDGYQLVVAPMLYLLRAGFEDKLKAFVERGGTLVGTYHTGLVDQRDLCYLGGWPGGGLGEVFGLWHETTDALYDEERNALRLEDGRSYEVKDLCALVHLRGAKALGTYGEDFYQGEPAFTVNQYGKGQAYYIASFAEEGFYTDFYQGLAEELGLEKALPQLPPPGVEACIREKEGRRWLFLENFSGEERELPVPAGYEVLLPQAGGEAVKLPPYGAAVLQSAKEMAPAGEKNL